MTDSPGHTAPLDRLRDQAIAALLPFFAGGHPADPDGARLAVTRLLNDYNAGTPRELQLATQIIALGWASLTCVCAAMVGKDQPQEEALRLQGYAIALDRLSQKAMKALESIRKARPDDAAPEKTRWDDNVFQMTIRQALEKMAEANARLATVAGTP